MRFDFLLPPKKPWHLDVLNNHVSRLINVLKVLEDLEKVEGRTIKHRLDALKEAAPKINFGAYLSYWDTANFDIAARDIKLNIRKQCEAIGPHINGATA